jgi:DNA-binding transcriptional LysR family regulator
VDRFAAMTAFVTVAEHKSFAAAARQLQLSAPSVTRLVAALEEELSIRLLQRSTRSVTLTAAGARYLERAQRILADVVEAESDAKAQRSEPSGRFVVAAPRVFGRREVSTLLSDFLRAHPAVVGELTLADRVVNLVDEGVDVAVRIGVLRDSILRVRALGATRRIIVASPKYLAQSARLRSPADLEQHATIQFTALSPSPEWRFQRGGADERVAISPRLVTNSAEVALAHALRGGGLAQVLAYQAKELLRSKQLEVVLAKFEPPPLPIQLVYSGTRLISANVRAFIDLALATRDWNFVDL